MHVYIGSDHGGFSQKELLKTYLEEKGYSLTDCGTYTSESTDYPDFAQAVGMAVREKGVEGRGILICRSGEGMEIAVNKIPAIRAALVWKKEVAVETRRDNDANVLVLPADFINEDEMKEICDAFLKTAFSGEERHIRRLEKISTIERQKYER